MTDILFSTITDADEGNGSQTIFPWESVSICAPNIHQVESEKCEGTINYQSENMKPLPLLMYLLTIIGKVAI